MGPMMAQAAHAATAVRASAITDPALRSLLTPAVLDGDSPR